MVGTNSLSLRRITLLAMLIALSVVGGYVKLGPWSIAFDAAAGFLAALLLGPMAGALVCGLGHLAAAGATGFPLSPAFHLLVALVMAGVGATGGLTASRFGLRAGAIVLILSNGLLAPALLALAPNPLGTGLFLALVLPLTLAATANATVALTLAGVLRKARLVP